MVVKAVITELSDCRAVSEIYVDDAIIDKKEHHDTSEAVYYIRWAKIPTNAFDQAIMVTNDGVIHNLLH